MNDLKYQHDNFEFFARASVLIFNKEKTKILLFNVEGRNLYMLPGGKIHESEESIEAIKREIKEELGWENLDYSFLGISEGFVKDKGFNTHQINLIYKTIYNDSVTESKFKGLEGEWINFNWIDIKNIDKYNVYPNNIKQMIKNPEKVYHFIENLMKNN